MEFHGEDLLAGNLSLRVFGSPAALAEALVGRVKEAVMTGIRCRGQAMLWLDGGPVLRRSYETLSGMALPWGCVRISTAGPSDPSNPSDPSGPAAFVRDVLCRDRAAQARWAPPDAAGCAIDSVGAANEAGRPTDEADRHGSACHDIVVLAMAADGSLPAWSELASAEAQQPGRGYRQLLDSHRIVIAAQGLRARDAFEREVLGGHAAGTALLTLSQESTKPLELCWCR